MPRPVSSRYPGPQPVERISHQRLDCAGLPQLSVDAVVPALVLTFLVGPAGLLLYLAIRQSTPSSGAALSQ